MIAEVLAGLLAVILVLCYTRNFRRQIGYWPSRGVPVSKYPPSFPFGNNPGSSFQFLLKRESLTDIVRKQYDEMRGHRFFGSTILLGDVPPLEICDLDLVQKIMVKDFSHFTDRVPEEAVNHLCNPDFLGDRIFKKGLLFLRGEDWKTMRATLSPIFTSGRMRLMSDFLESASSLLVIEIELDLQNDRETNLQQVLNKFSMDVIGSCVFGIDPKSFNKKKSQLVHHGEEYGKIDAGLAFRNLVAMIPGGKWLLGKLGKTILKEDTILFFFNLIKETVERRRRTGERRRDLIDLMSEALTNNLDTEDEDPNEEVEDNDKDPFTRERYADANGNNANEKKRGKDLDIESLAAAATILFIAGYDATAQTMQYAFHALALNQDAQERVLREVDDAVAASGDTLPSYAVISGMEYLEMVVNETLRLNPIPQIQRVCTGKEGYFIAGADRGHFRVQSNQEVHIPVAGIHRDSRHYREPEKFSPERFSKEEVAKRHPCAFLGFGHGPRMCLGRRFAMYEAKIALVAVLSKYRVVATENTPRNPRPETGSFLIPCADTLWVKFVERGDRR